METVTRWKVVLAIPGESEMGLIAELAGRRDVRIVAVIDPHGDSVGASLAEAMQVPVLDAVAEVPKDTADYLIYPAGGGEVNDMAAAAEERGWTAILARDFRPLVRERMPEPREVVRSSSTIGFLEQDTQAIHRTLSRIEEALEQESLMRWLLSLATRSVGASRGSLMLFDERTEELYIAFAYGLSDATMHRTRLRLGEGIAGQVAQSREPRLLVGVSKQGPWRDRPEISSGVVIPLVWEERLLGVLNISTGRDEPELAEKDLDTVAALSHRFGMILARFLRLQDTCTGEMFRLADRHLCELAERGGGIGEILPAWACGLAVTVTAARVNLTIPCEDGSLLVAEGTAEASQGLWHEALENAAWCDVLETGAPLVVRQEEPVPAGEKPLTVFYLPVGQNPVQAVLTLSFDSGQSAHAFHALSGELVYLVERRLTDLIRTTRQEDHLQRLSKLSRRLATMAAGVSEDPSAARESLLATARGLSGAQRALVVSEVENERARFAGGDIPSEGDWPEVAAQLLKEAGQGGWRVTLVSDTTDPQLEEASVLTVVPAEGMAAPGLILGEKQRIHPLDGALFTEFDAQLMQQLAGMLPAVLAAVAAEEAAESATKSKGEPKEAPKPADPVEIFEAADGRSLVRDAIHREMNRCDRYHTTFALVALRPTAEGAEKDAPHWARLLADKVRSSDRVFALIDSTILIMIPEDTQAMSRIQRRMMTLLREVADEPDLKLQAANTVYPGRHDSADLLLADTLASLA